MSTEFVRPSVFREDHLNLLDRFGVRGVKPSKGMLVRKALEYIDELETQLKENTK